MESFTAGLISLEEAQAKMLAQLQPLRDRVSVPLADAVGRITALPVTSPIDVPPFDNSAMDGYAVRLADIQSDRPLKIAGKAFAGAPFNGDWPAGSAVRIMTGAPVPPGCEAVVMQEETREVEDGIVINAPVRAGQNIRLIGEDIRRDQPVLAAGVRLGAAELPLLASLGLAEVSVLRKLRVAVFSTGDELQPVGQPLAPGQIYDTNRFAVSLMLRKLGCEVIDLGIIKDDPQALRRAFARGGSAGRRGDQYRRRVGRRSGFHQNHAGRAGRHHLLEAGHQAGQAFRLRPSRQQLVLRAAGQSGLGRRHLLSTGAAAARGPDRPERIAAAAAPARARRLAPEKIPWPPRFPARRHAPRCGRRAGGAQHWSSGLARL